MGGVVLAAMTSSGQPEEQPSASQASGSQPAGAPQKQQLNQGVYVEITIKGKRVDGIGPKVPFNRQKHYKTTPTPAARKHFGGSPDHVPPLVVRYYEGDPSVGELPGFLQTQAERTFSAHDRSRMQLASGSWRAQGGELRAYALRMRAKYGL